MALAFGLPFNANADNFSIRIKDQNTLLGDNSQNVEVAGIFPGCFVMFAHEAPLDLIRVRVVKRKYQFEKENVKSGNGFEFPQFVHMEVSPKMSLADLKILIKKKLHVGQSAPV